MSRTGVLLKKEGGTFVPIKAIIDEMEYLIELKGAGCPLGGFSKFHIRNQAGTYLKGHLRLTGGSHIEGIKNEYEKYQLLDQYPIKSLAYSTYFLIEGASRLPLGMLLRMTPSNIRFSFCKNEAIHDVFHQKEDVFFRESGKLTSTLAGLPEPHIHRNNSLNNMVYIDEERWVLSDFEEVTPMNGEHCNLDFIEDGLPYLFLEYNDEAWERAFISGAASVDSDYSSDITMEAFRDQVWKKLSINQYLNGGFYHGEKSIQDNLKMMKSWILPGYFEMPLEEWVRGKLVPNLKEQLGVLNDLLKACETLGKEVFLTQLKNYESSLFSGIQTTWPDIYKGLTTVVPLFYGQYMKRVQQQTFFLRGIDGKESIEKRKAQLTGCLFMVEKWSANDSIGELDQYICRSLEEFENMIMNSSVYHIYPFISWLSVYLNNIQRYYQTVISEGDCSSVELNTLELAQQRLTDYINDIVQNPMNEWKGIQSDELAWVESVSSYGKVSKSV